MNLVIIIAAKYLIYLLVLVTILFVVLWTPRDNLKALILHYMIGIVVAYILVKLAGAIYYNPRPFVENGIAPLVVHSPTNGFPSNHTVAAALIALLFWQYSKRLSLVLFIAAVTIGLARVLANVHHLEDIIAGILVALFATLFSNLAVHFITDRKATASEN